MMNEQYVDEFCTSCGTSPCSHPDMGAALALAERDRFARMLASSLLANLLLVVGLVLALVAWAVG